VNWLKFWSDFRDSSHAGEGKGNVWSAGKASDKEGQAQDARKARKLRRENWKLMINFWLLFLLGGASVSSTCKEEPKTKRSMADLSN
jgi:hypothetical protein